MRKCWQYIFRRCRFVRAWLHRIIIDGFLDRNRIGNICDGINVVFQIVWTELKFLIDIDAVALVGNEFTLAEDVDSTTE